MSVAATQTRRPPADGSARAMRDLTGAYAFVGSRWGEALTGAGVKH